MKRIYLTQEQEKALDDSIGHWQRMIEWAKKNSELPINFDKMGKEIGERNGAADCALCILFIENRCRSCPLKKLGQGCASPFSLWWCTCGVVGIWEDWIPSASKMLSALEQIKKTGTVYPPDTEEEK